MPVVRKWEHSSLLIFSDIMNFHILQLAVVTGWFVCWTHYYQENQSCGSAGLYELFRASNVPETCGSRVSIMHKQIRERRCIHS